jgi:hypothetical protein
MCLESRKYEFECKDLHHQKHSLKLQLDKSILEAEALNILKEEFRENFDSVKKSSRQEILVM